MRTLLFSRLSIFGAGFLLTLFLFAFPSTTAAVDGLVTCTAGNTCGTCELVQMIERIIDFIITIMLVVATIIFAYAGFLMVTSGGNQSQIEKGKSFFINTLIGLILMLCAWLIVDTIMKSLVAYDGAWGETRFGPWHGLSCTVQEHLEDGATITSGSSWEGVDPIFDSSTNYYVVYKLEDSPHADCKARFAAEFPDSTMCVNAYNDVISSLSGETYYVERDCGGASGGTVPDWVTNTYECNIGATPSGQICYSSGECFDTVTLSSSDYTTPGSCSTGPAQFIELNASNKSRPVSSNFTLSQVAVPKDSAHYGDFAFISRNAVDGLERVRQAMGASITVSSGYRSPGYNAHLAETKPGVATCSQHMYGYAFDILDTGGRSSARRAQLCNACVSAGAGYIKYDYDNHIHCDFRAGGPTIVPTDACGN